MKSYSSEAHSLASRFRDVFSLYRLHSNDVLDHVRNRIEDMRRFESAVESQFGICLENLDVLEIGPGQFLTQLTYLGVENRAIGIDNDVIVQGFDLAGYIRMFRRNSLYRTVKTVARKLLGIDRRYALQLKRQLGLRRLPRLSVREMDVRNMSFGTGSFDIVYCRSVLHHLPDPGRAVDEIVRVVRPGGVAYISIHPYTSETGCLDPRIYTGRRCDVEGWPHLRPHLRDKLREPNAHLNRLRLSEWRDLFGSKMPGAKISTAKSGEASLQAAMALQREGELLAYSLEELLTGDFTVLWQKPGQFAPVPRIELTKVAD
jgi:SAM-dependent methyltransferase